MEAAKAFMIEAGYPDGFEVDLTPAIRGAPAEVEACEAIGDMLADIGITVHMQKVPYLILREAAHGRTESGWTCHSVAPYVEPAIIQGYMWYPDVGWNVNPTHPFLTSPTGAAIEPNPGILERINNTFDTEERWELARELGDWL